MVAAAVEMVEKAAHPWPLVSVALVASVVAPVDQVALVQVAPRDLLGGATLVAPRSK